jgi:hypothetical protein
MTAKPFRLFLAAIVLTAMAVPSFAHHSTANYDSAKEIGIRTAFSSSMPSEAAEYRRVMTEPRK